MQIATKSGFLRCGFDIRGLVTYDFAVSFVCGVERRRCVVLGSEQLWPGDAFLEMLF
jgi:hypothetical protein